MLQNKEKPKNRHTDEGDVRSRIQADEIVHYNPRTGVYYQIRKRSATVAPIKKIRHNFWEWLLGREFKDVYDPDK